jgi:hypothetical protein
MGTSDGRWGPTMAMVCAMTAAAIGLGSNRAEAFELKHTSQGLPLHWPTSKVSYVIDPTVDEAVAGGAQAVSKAVEGWSGAAGTPALSTSVAKRQARPGLDGQNTVLVAPEGFAPAANALAVTVTSYDETTGYIIDADIVINGNHPFAVLADRTRPASGAVRISTEGAQSEDDDAHHATPFDLIHVVSHEVGHSLGLGDVMKDDSALMYAFTTPGDSTVRGPTTDDVDGVATLYSASSGAAAAPPSQSGCGQASVAGSGTRPGDASGAWILIAGAGLWLTARGRSRRGARVALPVAAALVALMANPAPAQSAASLPSRTLVDAAARVTRVSTTNVGGLFETTVELAPTACANVNVNVACPAAARAHAWGGTLGGIRQEVGGNPVPAVGDLVQITLQQVSSDFVVNAQSVAVVTLRH